MPKIIKDGAVIEDSRASIDCENSSPEPGQICTLQQWQELTDKQGSAVQLEAGQEPAPLLADLEKIELVVINFSLFTDGRGFSYGRELRERGYSGELRATGHFIRDQLTYLGRCGFNSFELPEGTDLYEALNSLEDFSEHYQASIDSPQPLFRRRESVQV
ncbi:MAG: DUF934 domain-containing protein [Halioglobus sp.]|nr:DUF934 domain-containing protein [Halioglobus sp.]